MFDMMADSFMYSENENLRKLFHNLSNHEQTALFVSIL